MKIAIIANDSLKTELLGLNPVMDAEIYWLTELVPLEGAACYIDLLFTMTTERVDLLKKLQPATIIVNAVDTTLQLLPEHFIRINGWPGFLKGTIVEAAGKNAEAKLNAEKVFTDLNKKIEWVPDITGFISARVLSMIINEAWFTLDEKVSSKEEIDTAMKLGTNYPYGPFEWGQKIGLKNIYLLLAELAKTSSRYEPAALLKKEALQ